MVVVVVEYGRMVAVVWESGGGGREGEESKRMEEC